MNSLEGPEAMIAVEFDESSDGDVDDVTGRIEGFVDDGRADRDRLVIVGRFVAEEGFGLFHFQRQSSTRKNRQKLNHVIAPEQYIVLLKRRRQQMPCL
jgi:hypothetical protein